LQQLASNWPGSCAKRVRGGKGRKAFRHELLEAD